MESLPEADLIGPACRDAVGCGEPGDRRLCAVACPVEDRTLPLALVRFPSSTSGCALPTKRGVVQSDQGHAGKIQPCRPNQLSAAEQAIENRPAQSQGLRRAALTVRRYKIAPMSVP